MKNENTSSDKELSFQSETRYLVFEMEVNKDSVLIQPKQDVSGNFADMMTYILGNFANKLFPKLLLLHRSISIGYFRVYICNRHSGCLYFPLM